MHTASSIVASRYYTWLEGSSLASLLRSSPMRYIVWDLTWLDEGHLVFFFEWCRAIGRDLEVGQPKSILLARCGLKV